MEERTFLVFYSVFLMLSFDLKGRWRGWDVNATVNNSGSEGGDAFLLNSDVSQ